MKKMKSRIASICLALCLAALMAGCAGVEKKEEKTGIKIGVAIYRGDDAFISSLCASLENEVKDKEEKLGKKVVVNIADAKNSQSSQNDQVDDFISKGYDAICVNMVDRTVAAVIVDKAKEAGIPIIFFNLSLIHISEPTRPY